MIAYLDANIVIYVVERHPLWGPKAEARITQLRAGGDQIATSDVHRLECLVGPLFLNDQKTLADYLAFFSDPDVMTVPVAAPVWERAARSAPCTTSRRSMPCIWRPPPSTDADVS